MTPPHLPLCWYVLKHVLPFLQHSHLLSLCWDVLWILPFLVLFHLSVSFPSLQRAADESHFFARCLWVQRLSTCLSQCRSANVSSVIGRSTDRSPHHLFILIRRTLRNTGRLCVLQNLLIQDEQIGSHMTDICCNRILCRPTRIQSH